MCSIWFIDAGINRDSTVPLQQNPTMILFLRGNSWYKFKIWSTIILWFLWFTIVDCCWILFDSIIRSDYFVFFHEFIKIIEQHHDPKQGVKCCSEQFGGEHINLALWLFEIQFHKHYHITTHYHTTVQVSHTHIHFRDIVVPKNAIMMTMPTCIDH